MSADRSTREAIMDATFAALCEHGYADLTMQAIADEFEKSKSLIHYHYDSKDELLRAFMASLDDFVRHVEQCGGDDPADRLRAMARIAIIGLDPDDGRDFHTALLELRAQAPYDEALRDQLVENDERLRKMIADVVREGQDTGQFRTDVDPETFAALFRSAFEGAQSHEVIMGDDAPTDQAMAGIEELLIERLLVGEGRRE